MDSTSEITWYHLEGITWCGFHVQMAGFHGLYASSPTLAQCVLELILHLFTSVGHLVLLVAFSAIPRILWLVGFPHWTPAYRH